MATVTHEQSLQSHTAFILATLFRPAEAPALAGQCLLPVAEVLPARRAREAFPPPYLTVEALVRQVEQAHLGGRQVAAVWVAEVGEALRRRIVYWPRLWQAPVRAYIAAVEAAADRAQREENAAFWRALFLPDGAEEASLADDAAEEPWGYVLDDDAAYPRGSGEPPLPEAALRQAWQQQWDEEPREQRGTEGGQDA